MNIIEQIASPNYTSAVNAAAQYGQPRTFQAIVIHWWGDPNNHPQLDAVIAHLRDAVSEVSAHYVVNDSRIVQMVDEENIAWHAKQANPFTIGIETDPNGGEAMYEKLGWLVNDIRARRGQLPLQPHNKYVQTTCPGTTDLPKIDQYANQGDLNVDYKQAYLDATAVAEARAGYLAKVALAAGLNPDHPLEEKDIDAIVADIDAKNKQIDVLQGANGKAAGFIEALKLLLR